MPVSVENEAGTYLYSDHCTGFFGDFAHSAASLKLLPGSSHLFNERNYAAGAMLFYELYVKLTF